VYVEFQACTRVYLWQSTTLTHTHAYTHTQVLQARQAVNHAKMSKRQQEVRRQATHRVFGAAGSVSTSYKPSTYVANAQQAALDAVPEETEETPVALLDRQQQQGGAKANNTAGKGDQCEGKAARPNSSSNTSSTISSTPINSVACTPKARPEAGKEGYLPFAYASAGPPEGTSENSQTASVQLGSHHNVLPEQGIQSVAATQLALQHGQVSGPLATAFAPQRPSRNPDIAPQQPSMNLNPSHLSPASQSQPRLPTFSSQSFTQKHLRHRKHPASVDPVEVLLLQWHKALAGKQCVGSVLDKEHAEITYGDCSSLLCVIGSIDAQAESKGRSQTIVAQANSKGRSRLGPSLLRLIVAQADSHRCTG